MFKPRDDFMAAVACRSMPYLFFGANAPADALACIDANLAVGNL